MPTYYVEDYEELTGLKRDDEAVPAAVVETKVIEAPGPVDSQPAAAQVETA